MLCSDLKDGMLVAIHNPDRKGWFNVTARNRLEKLYESKIPPRFCIGPDIVSYLMRLNNVDTFVEPGEAFIYLGRQKVTDKHNRTKNFRLVFVNGSVAYLEGRDVRYLSPVK